MNVVRASQFSNLFINSIIFGRIVVHFNYIIMRNRNFVRELSILTIDYYFLGLCVKRLVRSYFIWLLQFLSNINQHTLTETRTRTTMAKRASDNHLERYTMSVDNRSIPNLVFPSIISHQITKNYQTEQKESTENMQNYLPSKVCNILYWDHKNNVIKFLDNLICSLST